MRKHLYLFIFGLVFSHLVYGEEIIPGVLSLNPKNLSEWVIAGDPGDYSFAGIAQPSVYYFRPEDNDKLQISVRMRCCHLEDKDIKQELEMFVNPDLAASNAPSLFKVNILSPVADTTLGGQKAAYVSFSRVLRSSEAFVALQEVYWVKTQTNRVVEVVLSSQTNSIKQLDSLRKYISTLRINAAPQK